MKLHIKKINFFLTIVTVLLFTGCENEPIEKEANTTGIIFKEISLKNEEKSKTDSKLIETINYIKNLRPTLNNITKYNAIYDFYINQEKGKYIQTAKTISYTFPIYRLVGDHKLENIVFTKNTSDNYDVAIIKYDITEAVFSSQSYNQLPKPVQYKVIKTSNITNKGEDPIDGGAGGEWVGVVMCCNNGHGSAGGTHIAGGNCTNSNFLYTTYIYIDNNSGNNGGISTSPTDYYGTGSTTTTASGGDGFINPYAPDIQYQDLPVYNDIEYINKVKSQYFYEKLDYASKFWISKNGAVFNEIIEYQIQNNWSDESRNFAYSVLYEIVSTPNNPLPSNIEIFIPNPANKIEDISDYLKCFDKTQPAVFTIYVDQPTANSNTPWSVNLLSPQRPNVGHTFISIKQGLIRRFLGFYPSSAVDLDNPSIKGEFENNSAHEYDVSLSLNISQVQLTKLIDYIKMNSTATYDLNSYNCTDFGMQASSIVGITLPSAYGTWGNSVTGSGGGDNPGQLGQNIRNLTIPAGVVKTTNTGTSLSNIGTCN
jgi:hypothetical protein